MTRATLSRNWKLSATVSTSLHLRIVIPFFSSTFALIFSSTANSVEGGEYGTEPVAQPVVHIRRGYSVIRIFDFTFLTFHRRPTGRLVGRLALWTVDRWISD